MPTPSAQAFVAAQGPVWSPGLQAALYNRNAVQRCRCGFTRAYVKWMIRKDGAVVMFQERECQCPCDYGPILMRGPCKQGLQAAL